MAEQRNNSTEKKDLKLDDLSVCPTSEEEGNLRDPRVHILPVVDSI